MLVPVSLFYERELTTRFAFRTSLRWWQFGLVAKDEKLINATVEGKFYTAKGTRFMVGEHPTGFFVNLYLKVRFLRYVNHIETGPVIPLALDEIKVQSIGLGLTFGYLWVLKRGLVIELVHGGGLMPDGLTSFQHTGRFSTVTSDAGRDYLRLNFRTGVHVGDAF